MIRCILATTAPIYGGVWRHILDLASGLNELNIDVEVLGPEAILPSLQERNPSIRFGVIGTAPSADVFHLHLADTYERHHGNFIRRVVETDIPVVVTEHLPRTAASDPSIHLTAGRRKPGATQWKTLLKRWSLSPAAAVIAVSEEDREFLVRRYSLDSSKVWAAPLEIDVMAAPTVVTSPNRFVAVGSVITQKGFDILVEASAFRTTQWTVDVYGNGPHRERLQRRAEELGGAVQFRGFSQDVVGEMRAARGVVIPSRWESGPYVLLEAMANARPVVVSNTDAMPRIVKQAQCGVWFESEDPEDLASRLDELVQSPDVTQTGLNGYEATRAMSTKHMASSNAEIYDKVLAR